MKKTGHISPQNIYQNLIQNHLKQLNFSKACIPILHQIAINMSIS